MKITSQQIRRDEEPGQAQQNATLSRSVVPEPVYILVKNDRQHREKEYSNNAVALKLLLSSEVHVALEQPAEGVGSS